MTILVEHSVCQYPVGYVDSNISATGMAVVNDGSWTANTEVGTGNVGLVVNNGAVDYDTHGIDSSGTQVGSEGVLLDTLLKDQIVVVVNKELLRKHLSRGRAVRTTNAVKTHDHMATGSTN